MSDFMTASETAERLGVSVARVYQLAREARLPHVRRGRRLLVPRAAWERWLSGQVERALEVERAG
jgi:excisionase family DNA binding protein